MSRQRKRKREKEKEKTFGKGRDLFCGGEDKQRRKRRKIIGKKNIFRRRKRKRRKILGEGKYIFFCGGEGQKEKLLYMGEWDIAYWLWSKMLDWIGLDYYDY